VLVVGGKTADCLPAACTEGPLSSTCRLARCVDKCLDSVHFRCNLLDVCADISFMYGNSQHMLLYKNTYFPTSELGSEGAVVCTTLMGWPMGQGSHGAALAAPSAPTSNIGLFLYKELESMCCNMKSGILEGNAKDDS